LRYRAEDRRVPEREKAMLHEFLKSNRTELIERCRRKVAARRTPHATPAELYHGVPLFLDQFTDMLGSHGLSSSLAAPPAVPETAVSGLHEGATRHGDELRRHEFTIDQVVHDYGDLCQSITELAGEQGTPITVQEFGVLNMRLDNAIASAVTEFSRQREVLRSGEGAYAMNERLGMLAHEMRNMLNTTILAITAIKMGSVGFGGATAGALDRSLIGMRTLIDRTLTEVRLEGGAAPLRERIDIGPFIAEVRVAAALEASQKGCALSVLPVEPGMFVEADRHILASAVSNLLQNAFKFTRPNSHVVLRAQSTDGRVLIEVEDECGGMKAGAEELIFRSFQQRGVDRTGVGLGLPLSRKGIQSSGGNLSVRNIPGRGCVFTIDLPQRS
jgi:signal transduction histidine kinase